MKKTSVLVVLLVALLLFAACAQNPASSLGAQGADETPWEERVAVRVAALRGPTGIGMVKLMEQNDAMASANRYEFTLSADPSEVAALVSSGSVDLAAVPVNAASTLYNKTSGSVSVTTVHTLGAFYILERGDTVNSIADLSGKTLHATGQGASPEYILNYILEANGISDCEIVYKTEHSELATLFVSGEVDLVMLPEPFVTTVMSKAEDIRLAVNLNDEWKVAVRAQGGAGEEMVTGCLIVSNEFAENNKEALEAFLKEYEESVSFVNGNVADASLLVAQYGIIADAAIAEKAIPNCNIVFISGQNMKQAMEGMLGVLYEANPQSVGGALPGDEFYYID